MSDSNGHDHAHGANKKALFIAFFLTTGYMIVEVIGGLLTNSLALLSDAVHMLSDSVSLLIAVLALKLGEKAANAAKTYGYKRFEILAAAINGLTLLGLNVWILYEAYQRLVEPASVLSSGMLIVAILGLCINITVAWVLMKGSKGDSLNVKAALLHVMGDLLGSVGAIIAALLIMFFGWNIADPLASALIAVLILISGIRITKDAFHILMEGTPAGVELEEVAKTIKSVKGVNELHDLHVWSITSGKNALSCHAVLDSPVEFMKSQSILRNIEEKLKEIGIGHITIQVEDSGHSHEDSLLCSIGDDDDGEKDGHEHGHQH